MLPLLLASRVNWRRVAGLGAAGALIALLAYVRLQGIALAQAELAYKNPMTTTVTKTVKVEGPVRIVTRTIREPGGREEVTREELRGAVTTSTDSAFRVEPVFGPARASGWLLGASVQPFHRWERDGWAAWGGYAFGGRLHLVAGIRGSAQAETMILWRF